MASYTSKDQLDLRYIVGLPQYNLVNDSPFDVALRNSLSIADGGNKPDDTWQTEVLVYRDKFYALQTKVEGAIELAMTYKADEVTVNYSHQIAIYKNEQVRVRTSICTLLGLAWDKRYYNDNIYGTMATTNKTPGQRITF